MAFPFLDLPPEIREKIYLLTCTSPSPIPLTDDSIPLHSVDFNSPRHHFFPHALLLTCHQIYHEVRPLYFSYNSFSLLLVRDPSPLAYFLEPNFRDNRLHIKSFQLVISRWGRHDFFLKEFAPLLSDMILNGSLRHLEVWVRKVHLLLSPKTDNETTLSQVEAVEKLIEILRDPYLENAILKAYVEELWHIRSTLEPPEDVSKVIGLEDVSNLIGRPEHLARY